MVCLIERKLQHFLASVVVYMMRNRCTLLVILLPVVRNFLTFGCCESMRLPLHWVYTQGLLKMGAIQALTNVCVAREERHL